MQRKGRVEQQEGGHLQARERPQEEPILLTSWSQPSSLQKHENIIFCCLSCPPCLWTQSITFCDGSPSISYSEKVYVLNLGIIYFLKVWKIHLAYFRDNFVTDSAIFFPWLFDSFIVFQITSHFFEILRCINRKKFICFSLALFIRNFIYCIFSFFLGEDFQRFSINFLSS